MRQSTPMRNAGHRRDALWIAAMVHRLSGLALACFLPLHFLALGLAIDGEARLDGFLRWTANPLVKATEAGLVFLLAVHMLGGIRVLARHIGHPPAGAGVPAGCSLMAVEPARQPDAPAVQRPGLEADLLSRRWRTCSPSMSAVTASAIGS